MEQAVFDAYREAREQAEGLFESGRTAEAAQAAAVIDQAQARAIRQSLQGENALDTH